MKNGFKTQEYGSKLKKTHLKTTKQAPPHSETNDSNRELVPPPTHSGTKEHQIVSQKINTIKRTDSYGRIPP